MLSLSDWKLSGNLFGEFSVMTKRTLRSKLMNPLVQSHFGHILYKGSTFPSKSGGTLRVMLQLKRNSFQRFFEVTRRLRIYRVSDIPKGGVGANEFHKHRSEIVTAEKGTFRLELEDLRGRVKAVKLQEGTTYGAIPPFILHTYVALTDLASLHVVANTLYDHYRPATYDTYSVQEFRKLQAKGPSSRRHESR